LQQKDLWHERISAYDDKEEGALAGQRGKGMPHYVRHDIPTCHPERSEGSPHEIPRRPSFRSGHLGMTRGKVPWHDKEEGALAGQ
jgi:hypothetical protein